MPQENSPTTNLFGGDIGAKRTASPAERGDIVAEPEAPDVEETPDDSNATDVTPDTTDDNPGTDTGGVDAENDGEDETGGSDSEASEEGDEGKPDNGKSDDPYKQKVPRARLNKEAEKRKQAESRAKELQRKLDELQAQQKSADTDESTDVAEAMDSLSLEDFEALQSAMLNENTADAFEIFKKMMKNQDTSKEKPLSRDELKNELRQELKLERENERMAEKAKVLAKSFPELDSNSDLADPDLIEEVIELRDYYIERGRGFADALEEAADIVSRRYELEDRMAKKAPAPATKAKAIDAEKKLKAAEAEQGKLQGDSSKTVEKPLDIRTMSMEAYKALSEEARRRMRGDFL